jgi:hypothetical protein
MARLPDGSDDETSVSATIRGRTVPATEGDPAQ